jgi:hypothetical protein
MTFATSNQLLAVSDVSAHNININQELERSDKKIVKFLNEVWFRKFLTKNPQYTPTTNLRADLLLASEWATPSIYYALAYNIYPKIAELTGVPTYVEQAQYHNLWEEAVRNLLEFGIPMTQMVRL